MQCQHAVIDDSRIIERFSDKFQKVEATRLYFLVMFDKLYQSLLKCFRERYVSVRKGKAHKR